MPNNIATRVIYESVKMLHPDGTVMCLTTERRANWFISRSLAEWEYVPGGKAFRLTFEPGGKGKHDNPFYIQERENLCVCCGSKEGLNRHHVFPTVFRKHLSTASKSGNSHDVLPICHECHELYEIEADKLKDKILSELKIQKNYSATEEDRYNRRIFQARAMLRRLNGGTSFVDEKGQTISPPLAVIERFKQEAQEQEIDVTTTTFYTRTHWGSIVMDHIHENNLEQEFVQRWRKHFVEIMNPQFLPEHWNVNAQLENLKKVRDGVQLNSRDLALMEKSK